MKTLHASLLLIVSIFFIIFLSILPSAHAKSNNALRIVGSYKNQAITETDLYDRINFIANDMTNISPENLKIPERDFIISLIEEKAKVELAELHNITASDAEIANTLQQLAILKGFKNIDGYAAYLTDRGLSIEHLTEFSRTFILWNKLVILYFKPQITVSEKEVEDTLQRIENDPDKTTATLLELFINKNSSGSNRQKAQLAQSIYQHVGKNQSMTSARGLAPFFSDNFSASSFGIKESLFLAELDPKIVDNLKNTKTRTLADLIETPEGYYIHIIIDRSSNSDEGTRTQISFKRFILDADQLSDIQEGQKNLNTALETTSCAQLQAVADQYEYIEIQDYNDLQYSTLIPLLKDLLQNLEVNQISQVIKNEQKFLIHMICNKNVIPLKLPQREKIFNNIQTKRAYIKAISYLNNALKNANVKIY